MVGGFWCAHSWEKQVRGSVMYYDAFGIWDAENGRGCVCMKLCRRPGFEHAGRCECMCKYAHFIVQIAAVSCS